MIYKYQDAGGVTCMNCQFSFKEYPWLHILKTHTPKLQFKNQIESSAKRKNKKV